MVHPPQSVPRLLAERLLQALAGVETGTLEVTTRRERHRVHVRAGHVVQVELAGGQEPLGLVLAEAGLLSLAELRSSLRRRSGELYGLSLVETRVLAPEAVSHGLRLQAVRRVARIYGLDEARFSFQPGPLPSTATASPGAHLHPVEVICLAARHPSNAQRSLAHVLARVKNQRVHLAVALEDLQRMAALRECLADAEWNALELVAEGCRLAELFTSGLLPAPSASALVEALLTLDLLRIEDAQGAVRVHPLRTDASAADPLREIRLEMRRGGEPHRLLGVPPGASRTALRTAYRRRALLLHPDRWVSGAPRDLPELFAAVAQAYRTLVAHEDRETKRAASG